MGACMSSGVVEVSEQDKQMHREAEKQLKEVNFHFLNFSSNGIYHLVRTLTDKLVS